MLSLLYLGVNAQQCFFAQVAVSLDKKTLKVDLILGYS